MNVHCTLYIVQCIVEGLNGNVTYEFCTATTLQCMVKLKLTGKSLKIDKDVKAIHSNLCTHILSKI